MLKSIVKTIKKIFGAGSWTCPRCGTTNSIGSSYCKYCKNRRPY